MNIHLPGKLNLQEVVSKYPPSEIPNFKTESLALVLAQIIAVKVFNKKLIDSFGFVPLHSSILKGLNRNYRNYLDYAVRCGIIDEKPQFIVGERCRHFKFKSEFDSPVVPFINQQTGRELIVNAKNKGEINLPKKYIFLARPFKSGDLELNKDAAEKFFEAQYNFYRNNPEKIPYNRITGKYKNPTDQYDSAMLNIARILEEDYFMLLDKTAGRLHTNFSNMPSFLRNYLTFKGEHLVSIDVSNCQPYLLNAVLRPEFYVYGSEIFQKFENGGHFSPVYDNYDEIEVAEGEIGIDKGFNLTKVNWKLAREWYKEAATTGELITLAQWVQTIGYQEIQQYKNYSVSGRYYEELQYHFLEDLEDDRFENRDDVKVESLRILFTGNSYLKQEAASPKKWFSEYFPGIYGIIYLLKKKNKKFFPALLQAIEAEIILNRIARRIMNERRSIPLFTIHDSIVTTPANVEYVKQVMCEEFTKCIGAPPHLKLEHYGPQNRKLLKLPFYKP